VRVLVKTRLQRGLTALKLPLLDLQQVLKAVPHQRQMLKAASHPRKQNEPSRQHAKATASSSSLNYFNTLPAVAHSLSTGCLVHWPRRHSLLFISVASTRQLDPRVTGFLLMT